MRLKRPYLPFLSALTVIGLSCRSVEDTTGVLPFNRGLPPLYEEYATPSSQRGLKGSEVFFRPFGSVERMWAPEPSPRSPLADLIDIDPEDIPATPDSRTTQGTRLALLFPFIQMRWAENETVYRVVPVFLYRERVKEQTGVDLDWMLFPLIFSGSDSQEGSYFAVFPFGGKVRGLLGQKEIDFVLFPVYARLQQLGRTSTHIVWPIGNYVSGAGWSGGRVWPFYGSYSQETEDQRPRSRRTFVMWPFYIRAEENLQTLPTESFFTFPFYGQRENERSVTKTYLWPLYVSHYDKKLDRSLVGGFIFPYRFGEAQYGLKQWDLWPFFGVKSTETERLPGLRRYQYRQFILWPVHRYEHGIDALEETRRSWVLPFVWRFAYSNRVTGEEHGRFHVWPLFSRRTHDGETVFETLYPLPFERESYRRHIGRWFALFRYRATADRTAWELLYGTVYWHSSEKESILSVLGGLLEVGSGRDGLIFRFLYVFPWW